MYDMELYKIEDIINPEFEGLDVNSVDFKRHLKPTIALNKKTFKDAGGRPNKAEYYLDDDLIAVINYEFQSNSDNLIVNRKEILRYILKTGEEGADIIIKNKTYDPNNSVDLEFMIQERQVSRKSIVTELKGVIAGAMSQAFGFSMDQVVAHGKPFWAEYATEISDFIEFGSLGWRERLITIDLSASIYTWLSIPVDANGTLLRDYLVYRLTY